MSQANTPPPVFTPAEDDTDTDLDPKARPTEPLSTREPGFESRVFGRWGSIVRYFCGTASVLTMCYVAYQFTVTTRISVEQNKEWPDTWIFLIMTFGVTICAMSFSNANKTISTILGDGNLKERAKGLILSKLGTNVPTVVNEYYWWNADTKAFVVLSDANDLSASGFIRVPIKRPADNSVWDPNTEQWMTPVS